MSGGMACNVERHLYVDLQLYVLTIYWTAALSQWNCTSLNVLVFLFSESDAQVNVSFAELLKISATLVTHTNQRSRNCIPLILFRWKDYVYKLEFGLPCLTTT